MIPPGSPNRPPAGLSAAQRKDRRIAYDTTGNGR